MTRELGLNNSRVRQRTRTHPSRHLRLNIIFGEGKTWWDAIDYATYTAAVRFAIGGYAEVGSECRHVGGAGGEEGVRKEKGVVAKRRCSR